jgi:exodeoxyribonuclease VII large subunit
MVWSVGALCKAVADALDARFSPITVRGELASFTKASSGHLYFSLKDAQGQIRCAMFRRSAASLDFAPEEGDLIEVWGRLTVYEQRGDLQLVAEGMRRAGQGTLFEQFLKLKAKLELEGLFEPSRKRELPRLPRAIGVVTSLGAAALHDVLTALRRRVPHVPVVVSPAAVQGVAAPQELISALHNLYEYVSKYAVSDGLAGSQPPIDVIVLVRGGGAIEDLWAFNDEALARTIAASPVPVVSGVGHETDFTIADFVADLRAPTPTAAAELVAREQQAYMDDLQNARQKLKQALYKGLDQRMQHLDWVRGRMGRPSALLHRCNLSLAATDRHLQTAWCKDMQRKQLALQRSALRLNLLNPKLVLQRGYAWLVDESGQTISAAEKAKVGKMLQASLANGTLEVQVMAAHPDHPSKDKT